MQCNQCISLFTYCGKVLNKLRCVFQASVLWVRRKSDRVVLRPPWGLAWQEWFVSVTAARLEGVGAKMISARGLPLTASSILHIRVDFSDEPLHSRAYTRVRIITMNVYRHHCNCFNAKQVRFLCVEYAYFCDFILEFKHEAYFKKQVIESIV